MASGKKQLVLIDGHAILHRAYHAFPSTLRTRKGEVVNAVYGFTRILLKVIEDLDPEYLAVTFDLPQPTFRHQEFLGYQAQRPQMDNELKDQIKRVRQVVKTLNIPAFSSSGFEADDVIATLAKQAQKKSLETIIVTGDKDIMQLINKAIKVYAPVKGFSQAKLFGEKQVKEALGVKPSQIVDYKALVGDSSDNYPGVPGIGPKTATLLLDEYKNLTTIYKSLNKIKPRVAQLLKDGKQSALLSQKLAQIVTNAPVRLVLKDCKLKDYNQEKVIELFQELEFRSLINHLPGAEPIKKEETKKDNQLSLI